MNNLTVIENELVPVYETSTGEKVVYGTELHEVLEVKSKFADWIKNRLNDCEANENEDFEAFSKNLENGGRSIEYTIKLDTAKEMAMLERNEKGKEVRRYFISVEKKYKESSINTTVLPPDLQMFKSIFDQQAKQYIEMQKLKDSNEQIEKKVEAIREVVSLDTTSWRTDTGTILKKIGMQLGGGQAYQEVRAESYNLLNKRMGVDITTRLTNLKNRMAGEGVSKSKRDKTSYLDVIDKDKKLIEGYTAIVKEMAIKYGIA